MYNDASPHENHHAAASFMLMRDPNCNFMEKMDQEVRDVRQAQEQGSQLHKLGHMGLATGAQLYRTSSS